MESTFRDQVLKMIHRLQAENMAAFAQAIRVGMGGQEQFDSVTEMWRRISQGADIDSDIDAHGRPITDSLAEFSSFVQYDRATLMKHGVIEHNEYLV